LAEVRIALLGAGSMGTVHAAAYATMPDVSVVGVFSRDPARAAAVAAICKASPSPTLPS
jgi:predicted dehydrogenase